MSVAIGGKSAEDANRLRFPERAARRDTMLTSDFRVKSAAGADLRPAADAGSGTLRCVPRQRNRPVSEARRDETRKGETNANDRASRFQSIDEILSDEEFLERLTDVA